MVVVPIKPQLSPRHDSDDGTNDRWSTLQIAAPIIVGAVLLLLFVAYVIWQRRKRSYDYRQVRSSWITKVERMLVPRRKRQRVCHSSTTVTLDDSMRTSGFTFDFNRRYRQSRSDSSDSQTPLTSTGYASGYPPKHYAPKNLSDPLPPVPKRLTVRWWWIFGSRPQQIRSEEPSQRWRVDDPDGSSSGHGHNGHGYRYAAALNPPRGDPDGEDEVIRIGENFSSIASTPMTQHFPEQVLPIRGMPTVPEQPRSGSRTPVPAASAPQSSPGTPVPSANHDLPPSYDISQSHTRYPSPMNTVCLARSGPYMAVPPPVRPPGYPSPHACHGRDLSSDSFLATQPPMVATSMY